MSALELYVKEVAETKGMFHLNALKRLRWYIKVCTEDELIQAINKINNTDYLRILIEAGLNKRLQDAVTTRYDDIIKRQMGVR